MDGLFFLAVLFFIFRHGYKWFEKLSKTATKSRGKKFFCEIDITKPNSWQEIKTPWQGVGSDMHQPGTPFTYFPMAEQDTFAVPETQEEGLSAKSLEGKDICDPTLGHNRDRVALSPLDEPESTQTAGAGTFLDFSGDAMVRSIVMSEILARPQRRWRGR